MKKNVGNKLIKAALTGAMALGVMGTAATADIPGLEQKASASVNQSVSTNGTQFFAGSEVVITVIGTPGEKGKVMAYKQGVGYFFEQAYVIGANGMVTMSFYPWETGTIDIMASNLVDYIASTSIQVYPL